MNRQFRWAAVLAALLVAVLVGVVSYNVGLSHGLAIGPAAGAPAGMIVPYGWYRPWGFGLFGPFMLVVFWFLLFRIFFWGGFHRRRWHHSGMYDAPYAFEEWHRRAHERMSGQPDASTENRV
jgi:hypothetical protein